MNTRRIFTSWRRSYTTTDWFEAKIIERKPINHNTLLFKFQLPKEKENVQVQIGENFSLQSANKLGPRRAYTPLLPLQEDGTLSMAIKVYSEGALTQVFSELQLGDIVRMKGPKERLKEEHLFYEPGHPKKLFMIAGGSGITPMLQVSNIILFGCFFLVGLSFLDYSCYVLS